MTKRKWLTLLTIILEGMMYYALMMLLNIPYRFRFLILYFLFQYFYKHYKEDNVLIWAEIKNIVISHAVLFLVEILFIDIAHIEIFHIAVSLIIMLVYEVVLNRFLRILFYNQVADRVLIIGTGSHAKRLIQISRSNRFALMNPIACIDVNGHPSFEGLHQEIQVDEIPVIPYKVLDETINQYQIDSVIIALPDAKKEHVATMMRDLFGKVPKIKYLPRVNSIITFDTAVEDFDGLLILSSSGERRDIVGHFLKRIVDIFAGIAGLILLIPLTAFIKIKAVSSSDHDSIFFTQERIGKYGKPIRIYKFRSMVPNAEAILEQMMAEDENIRKEYQENKKLKNDPRITEIGHFIRKTSLDEFPQFINVLKGEMSLIGPRPYLFREIEDMDIYYNSIIKCKPGITGMWQANGRSEVSFHERCKLDDYYYRNWNIWLDFTIIYKTIKGVIYGRGAL